MRDGIIQQIATPKTIYDEPANAFVADFIGESNILSGTMLEDYKVEICGNVFECVDKGFKKNEPIDVIIRPEDIKIKKDSDELLKATVLSCIFKGDHYLITVQSGENELIIHNTTYYEPGSKISLYIKPFDFHIMHKAKLINTVDAYMVSEGVVDICGGHFDCNSTLDAGTLVTATIDFDDVEITDDPEDGIIEGTVVSSIYKGSYYQCIVKTDDYYDFFVDTDYEYLKGDRVGLTIPKDKIIIEERKEEKSDEEKIEEVAPVVEDQAIEAEENIVVPVKRSLEEAAQIMDEERYSAVEETTEETPAEVTEEPVKEEIVKEEVIVETITEEPVKEEIKEEKKAEEPKPAKKTSTKKAAPKKEEKVEEKPAEETKAAPKKTTTKSTKTEFVRNPGVPRNKQPTTKKK